MQNSAVMKEILRDYERVRTAAEAALRQRREDIYNTVPRIVQIDKELSLTGVKIAKMTLLKEGDPQALLATLREQSEVLKKEKERLLQKHGFSQKDLRIWHQCEKCGDTGFIGEEKCSCFLQRFVDKAYGQSNLRDIVKAENFRTFQIGYYSKEVNGEQGISPRDNMEVIFKTCIRFVTSFGEENRNLLLYGSTGLGKTFLCNCIAKELLEQGHTVLYQTAGQLFTLIEEERFRKWDEEEKGEARENAMTVDLLVIDDLGTEFSTLLTSSELFSILNSRLLAKKATILSTNLKLSDLKKQYSDRIVSRIMGEYTALYFFGDDIRKLKKFG